MGRKFAVTVVIAILTVVIATFVFVGGSALRAGAQSAQSSMSEIICSRAQIHPEQLNGVPVVRVLCDAVASTQVTPTDTPVSTQELPTETPVTTGTSVATATERSRTPTPGATISPTPGATIEPPPMSDHNTLVWHAASEGVTHSHGVDPMSTIFADFIADYFPEHDIPVVSHPWLTSAHENAWPINEGKHDGFVWLYEEDTGCDQFNPGGQQSPGPCVKAYLLQVHSMRTGVAIRTRFHSESVIALVCQQGGGPPCDIVYTGGFADYGQNHSRYKRDICWGDPANPYPESAGSNIYLNQPPYRTQIGSAQTGFFWSSLINTLGRTYLEPDPSNVLEVAWNDLDVFSSESVGPDCFDPAADTIHPNARGTRHQVFSIYLHIDNFPRPFEGWTDVHGNRRDDCSSVHEAGCVPIYIGPNVPANGTAFLNRAVMHGDNNIAPIQDFYNGFPVEMNMYGYDH